MFSSFPPCFSLLPCFCLFTPFAHCFSCVCPCFRCFPLVFHCFHCSYLFSLVIPCFSCFSRSLFSLAPLFLICFLLFPGAFFLFSLVLPCFSGFSFLFLFYCVFLCFGVSPPKQGKNRGKQKTSRKQRKTEKNSEEL